MSFTAGAQLDGDGANGQFGGDPCYAPESYAGKTLDVLADADHPGNWYAIVTDSNGKPVVQRDPCPGAYISTTSLFLPDKDGEPLLSTSPFKYVDAATVPYVVVAPIIIRGVTGVVMGCRVIVTDTRSAGGAPEGKNLNV